MDFWWRAAVAAVSMCVPWAAWRMWVALRGPRQTASVDVARAGRERVSTRIFEQSMWLVALCGIVVFVVPVSPLAACGLAALAGWWWRSIGAGSRP
jgi:hypothetical protein